MYVIHTLRKRASRA